MGCAASGQVEEAKEFALSLMKIGIKNWDDLFDEVGKIAGVLGGFYSGMNPTAVDKLYFYLGMYQFKEPTARNMYDALKIFLWSVAAYNNGKILEVCKPQFMMTPPFFQISVGESVNRRLQLSANIIVDYIKAVLMTAPKIPDLVTGIIGLIEKSKEMVKHFKEDLEQLKEMSAFQKTKAGLNITRGVASIVKIAIIAPKLPEMAKTAYELCVKLQKDFQTILEESKQQGMKCLEQGYKHQKEIVFKCYPGAKLTKVEYNDLVKLKKLKKKYALKKRKHPKQAKFPVLDQKEQKN